MRYRLINIPLFNLAEKLIHLIKHFALRLL